MTTSFIMSSFFHTRVSHTIVSLVFNTMSVC